MLCVLEDTPPVTNTNISRGTCKMQFSLGPTVFKRRALERLCRCVSATLQRGLKRQAVFDTAAHFTRSAKMAGGSDPSVTTVLVA